MYIIGKTNILKRQLLVVVFFTLNLKQHQIKNFNFFIILFENQNK